MCCCCGLLYLVCVMCCGFLVLRGVVRIHMLSRFLFARCSRLLLLVGCCVGVYCCSVFVRGCVLLFVMFGLCLQAVVVGCCLVVHVVAYRVLVFVVVCCVLFAVVACCCMFAGVAVCCLDFVVAVVCCSWFVVYVCGCWMLLLLFVVACQYNCMLMFAVSVVVGVVACCVLL